MARVKTPEELLMESLGGGSIITDPNAGIPDPAMNNVYDQSAERYARQADNLDRQAAVPMAKPKGTKEHLVSAARAFMEGMASPRDPYAMANRREDMHQQEQAQLVARAKALRGDALNQQQLAQGERRDAFTREVQNRPQPFEGSPGSVYGARDPQTGKITVQGSVPTSSTTKYDERVVVKNGKEYYQYTHPSNPGVVVYEAEKGPMRPVAQPGSMQPTVDQYGNITGMVNTETGEVTPPKISPKIEGPVRKVPATEGALKDSDEAMKAVANINNLGGLFKPEFVGMGTSQYLSAKSMLPEGMRTLPEGYAQFKPAQSALKSDVIKAITGAQMNQNEEARILSSIPHENLQPDMWMAAYEQLRQRINVIAALKQQHIGAGSYTLEDLDAIASGKIQLGQHVDNSAAPNKPTVPSQGSAAPPAGGGRVLRFDSKGNRIQ